MSWEAYSLLASANASTTAVISRIVIRFTASGVEWSATQSFAVRRSVRLKGPWVPL